MRLVWEDILIALVTAAASAVVAYIVRLNSKISKMGLEIATLQTQVNPLWRRIQNQIARDLHHPQLRYREMDKLLEKLEGLTIEDKERDRLKELLVHRSLDMHPDISPIQRKKAELMSNVMDMVVMEAGDTSAVLPDSVVAVPEILKAAVAATASGTKK